MLRNLKIINEAFVANKQLSGFAVAPTRVNKLHVYVKGGIVTNNDAGVDHLLYNVMRAIQNIEVDSKDGKSLLKMPGRILHLMTVAEKFAAKNDVGGVQTDPAVGTLVVKSTTASIYAYAQIDLARFGKRPKGVNVRIDCSSLKPYYEEAAKELEITTMPTIIVMAEYDDADIVTDEFEDKLSYVPFARFVDDNSGIVPDKRIDLNDGYCNNMIIIVEKPAAANEQQLLAQSYMDTVQMKNNGDTLFDKDFGLLEAEQEVNQVRRIANGVYSFPVNDNFINARLFYTTLTGATEITVIQN